MSCSAITDVAVTVAHVLKLWLKTTWVAFPISAMFVAILFVPTLVQDYDVLLNSTLKADSVVFRIQETAVNEHNRRPTTAEKSRTLRRVLNNSKRNNKNKWWTSRRPNLGLKSTNFKEITSNPLDWEKFSQCFYLCLHKKKNSLYHEIDRYQLSVCLYLRHNQLDLWNLNKLHDNWAVIKNLSAHYSHRNTWLVPSAACFIRFQKSWLTGLETLTPWWYFMFNLLSDWLPGMCTVKTQ